MLTVVLLLTSALTAPSSYAEPLSTAPAPEWFSLLSGSTEAQDDVWEEDTEGLHETEEADRALEDSFASGSWATPPPNDDDEKNFKVIGRGLMSRTSDAVLQLACVGERTPGKNERSCLQLQFLHTRLNDAPRLIGPVLNLHIPDEASKRELKKQIHQQLRENRLAAPRKLANSFPVSGLLYGSRGDEFGVFWVFFSPLAGAALAEGVFNLTGIFTATGLTMATGGVILGTFLLPVIIDAAILPLQVRRARRRMGYFFGSMGPNVTADALQDRSVPYWQLKPKAVSGRGFSRLVRALEEKTPKVKPDQAN